MSNKTMAAIIKECGENLIGFVLQEATFEARPKLLSDNGQVCIASTVLQDTSPNRNKRIYSAEVLIEALNSASIQEKVKTRTFLGEANHPFASELTRQIVIDLTRASHLITVINPPPKSGGQVTGTFETTATSIGRDMRGLVVENHCTIAFSMRGVGGVTKASGGFVEVSRPLAIIAYDWVTFPSHKAAYMNTGNVQNEGVSYEGVLGLTKADMNNYAKDQSSNVRSLIEQFEIQNASVVVLNEKNVLVSGSNGERILAFVEPKIRRDFRQLMTRF